MCQPLSDAMLLQTWQRMHMLGDFAKAMQNPLMRQTLEIATRAWQFRDARRAEHAIDFKRQAAGDQDE